MKKELIKYFKSLGIEVYTNTKARGHQGFFLNNRIDISKNVKEERIIPTLLHEFAHYIHNKLEPGMVKTGGSLDVLFDCHCEGATPEVMQKKIFFKLPHRFTNCTDANDFNCVQKKAIPLVLLPSNLIVEELLQVTNFIDENSLCLKLKAHKEQIKKKIKAQEDIIKQYYPNFMRSKKFKEFDKYIKKSKAKYLLKYDRVKFITPHIFKMLKKEEIFTITRIEQDFPDMPRAFCAYIRLKSFQKKQARISTRINKLNKYYQKPSELFARLVECIYIDKARALALAPYLSQRFFELLEQGYYFELKNVFEILQKDLELANY